MEACRVPSQTPRASWEQYSCCAGYLFKAGSALTKYLCCAAYLFQAGGSLVVSHGAKLTQVIAPGQWQHQWLGNHKDAWSVLFDA